MPSEAQGDKRDSTILDCLDKVVSVRVAEATLQKDRY
jgi:hypothetical protein